MRFRPAITAILVIAALCLGTLGASASDEKRRKAAVDRAMEQLQHDLAETSQSLAKAVIALKQAEAKLPAARSAVARVRGQLAAAQERDRQLGEQLRVAQAEVQRAERAIAETEKKIAVTQAVIGKIARSSYQRGNFAELAVVLESDSPDDFATRLVLVQNAMRSQGNVLGDLADSKADLAAQKAALDAKKTQLANMKREQEKVVAKVKGLERQAVAAQRQVESLVAARSSAVQTIAREKAADTARYQRMQAESRRLQAVLAERARQARLAAARANRGNRGGGSYNAGGGALARPASGPITSPYGMRVHPVTGVYKLHDGTDFGVSCGTPVHAAASGTVIQAANVGGYGNQLVIDHGVVRGVGLATSYNHLMRFTVGSGAHVSRGQVIGYSGGGAGMYGAGYSTGCHLHFMVYVNGNTVNPMSWL